jgi:hypothetical protein
MNIQSTLAACRSELLLLAKSIIRVLLWVLLIAIGVLTVFILFPPAGVMLGQTARSPQISPVQAWVLLAMMLLSLLSILLLAKSQNPERKTWIGIHAGIVGVGAATFPWLPPWSGFIMAAVFVLLVYTPNVLGQVASRRASAGHTRAAAFYARLICLFHPSRQARFQASFRRAQALGSTEEKVAAYRSLAAHAAPEHFVLLNCYIAIARDDWEGVLAQIRSAAEATSALKWFEIRALGELGRVQEMAMTYVWAESDLSASNRLFCRLYVLAFSGHFDGVRSLLSRRLRFLRSRNKAYWIFIASQAAGMHDDDARRTLASYVDAADDETFRRAAQRHLAEAPAADRDVLSPA